MWTKQNRTLSSSRKNSAISVAWEEAITKPSTNVDATIHAPKRPSLLDWITRPISMSNLNGNGAKDRISKDKTEDLTESSVSSVITPPV